MTALCVDDEPIMLALLKKAVEASPDIDTVYAFEEESDALEWAETHRFDVAFLDIELHGISGTEIARRLRVRSPFLPIIFCTGYSEYALDAMRLHADGYLLKPIHVEDVQSEPDRLIRKSNSAPLLYVSENRMSLMDKNGEAVVFHRSRTNDLMRILIEAGGKPITKEELCDRLFEHSNGFLEKNRNYFFQLIGDLTAALARHGADEVLIKSAGGYALNMEKIKGNTP